MAYVTKYQILFPSQQGDDIRVDIKENDYAGDVIQLRPAGLSHRFLPAGDDPFEPVYASEVTISVDITDTLADMPDFTSLDDRKYHVIIYRNYPEYAEWYGWVLSDNVQINYSSGVRMLTFQCVDGLGMLDYILFPEADDTNINSFETLLYFIRISLASIEFPANLTIWSCVSYYANGMDDRSDNPAAEPFLQSYMPFTTFKDSDYKYISCLQILKNIMRSFGCRLVQARGAWYILSINEMADPLGFYYTEYSPFGTVLSSGRTTYEALVQGWNGLFNENFFQNGNQIKIMLKGFNNIYGTAQIEYPSNSINNWTLKNHLGNNATGWNEVITGMGVGTAGTIEIIDNADEKYATYRMNKGTRTNPAVTVFNTSMSTVPGNTSIKYAMTFIGQDLDGGRGRVILGVTSGGTTYWFSDNRLWVLDTGNPDYIDVPQFNGGNYINDWGFTTPPTPIAGQLTFGFRLDSSTVSFVQVGNFRMQFIGEYRSLEVIAKTNDFDQYTKKVNLPYGFFPGIVSDVVAKGVISLSTAEAAGDWYRFGKPIEQFAGLTELVIQQYINIFKKNVINVNGTIWPSETEFSSASVLTFEDTDPAQINIADKYYIMGATEKNMPTNEVTGVFLEISNEDIKTDIVSKYYFTGSEAAITYNP